MPKEAAFAHLQAAAYWKNVARIDHAEIGVATAKVSELTTAARHEEREPAEIQRRPRGVSAA